MTEIKEYIHLATNEELNETNVYMIINSKSIINPLDNKSYSNTDEKMYIIFTLKCLDSDSYFNIITKYLSTFIIYKNNNTYIHLNFNILIKCFNIFKQKEYEQNILINDILYKEAESMLEKKYEPPVERIRKINEAKHLSTETINEKFKEVNMCLLEEYTGNCEDQQTWGCLNILKHSFRASYSHAKWKYLDGNNKKGLVGKKGCPYCSKQQILDKIKWYSYKNNTWEFIQSFESFEDLKEKEKNNLDTDDKVKIIKNIVREERWLTPVGDVVYSILSPDESGKLNLNKVLTEYETFIIQTMEINYNLMKQRIFKSKFNLIISIDEQGKKAYVSDSMTQLSLKLTYVGTADKKLNRKTIAKYVDSEKNYAGYIFRSCDNSLIEKYKEKYEVVVI